MKNDIDRLYLIDRYLKGELSGPSLDEFRTKMRLDPDFVKEIESQRAIIEGIKLARRQHLIALLRGEKQPISYMDEPKSESKVKENDPYENTLREDPLIEKSVFDENEVSKEKNVFEVIGQKVDISTGTERKTYQTNSDREVKGRINFNNWYYAAAAVLFAGFFLYFLFGYYLPRQQNNLVIQDTVTVQEPEVVQNNQNPTPIPSDSANSSINSKDSSNNLVLDGDLNDGIPVDSLKIEKDIKIDQNSYLVPGYETLAKSGTGNGNNNVSSGDPVGVPKVKTVVKVAGSLVKIEYWESAVGFKGYKLLENRLLLFDTSPKDKVSLTYLDNTLYMKKAGVYYKMKASSKFEQYTKETNQEIIKVLQAN
jgi:hypothetical protein